MKKTILLTVILTSIFLYGCNNSATQTQPNSNQPPVPSIAPKVQTPPVNSAVPTPPDNSASQNPSTKLKHPNPAGMPNSNVIPTVPTPPNPESATTPPIVPTENKPTESAKQLVTIKDFAFTPSNLTISVGTTVSWTNEDSAAHRVKFIDFDSAILSQGQSFEHKFETAGTYDYFCLLHRSMRGQIIVK